MPAEWARQDSNLEPSGYEPLALPLSYKPPILGVSLYPVNSLEAVVLPLLH